MAGKGSRQRPTDKAKYESNWDRIFSKPSQKPQEPVSGKSETK